MTFAFIEPSLAARASQGLLRRRKVVSHTADGVITIDGQTCLNFASNDYLGLSQHPDVLQAYVEGLTEFGAGSTASAVICGYMRPHHALESLLCELFNKEAVLLINSGFAANQALCQALFCEQAKDASNILCDKRMHASFIEGALHANARFQRYQHNDILHFQQKLKHCQGNTLVATEGVFSMDGDIGNIAQMQSVLKDYEHQLLVDDAHGFGVIGKTGLGVSEILSINSQKIDILMATFGKAIGTGGAFIAGSAALIEYLVNFAKHYTYSTALPPAQALATIKSIEIMQTGSQREKLLENIGVFKQLCKSHRLAIMPSDTAIQPLIIGDAYKCTAAASALMDLGIYVPAIRSPTVAKGSERLRITLSALHNERDIHALVDALCLLRHKQSWHP